MTEEENKKKDNVDLEKLKEEFVRIILKYNLKDEKKAKDIADYLTRDRRNKISIDGFAKRFKMDIRDAKVFLAFIVKGLEFKETHIDKKGNK